MGEALVSLESVWSLKVGEIRRFGLEHSLDGNLYRSGRVGVSTGKNSDKTGSVFRAMSALGRLICVSVFYTNIVPHWTLRYMTVEDRCLSRIC